MPGNKLWKRKVLSQESEELLITIKSEAFAMIILENNYISWLLEEKLKGDNLVCEYDMISNSNSLIQSHCHIVEVLLPNILIDFTYGIEEKGYLVSPHCDNFDLAKESFETSKQHCLDHIDKSKYNNKYKEAINNTSDLFKKGNKRKTLKQLRPYTCGVKLNKEGKESKCHGWSYTVTEKMRQYTVKLKEREEKRNKFQMAYKYAYQQIQKKNGLDNKAKSKITFDDLIEEEDDIKNYLAV